MRALATRWILLLGLSPVLSGQVQVDPTLPAYTRVKGVAGNLKSVGSDTMNNLLARWAEGFRAFYPNVEVEVEGHGSSTAPPALIEGTAALGPMSREMKSVEIDQFEASFGYKPLLLRAGVDMLAVYVNKDNPIAQRGLTIAELDAIYSKTRKAGHPRAIRTWGDLGLTGDWAEQPISVYSRNSASGTYGFFKQRVLKDGDFRDEVKEQSGSSSVVQGVARDRFAIGYSGMGYATADVVAVPIGRRAEAMVVAAPENVRTYPLCRFLLVYVNYEPNSRLDPLRREFLRYAFSRDGQTAVVQDGYLPLDFAQCQRTLASIGVTVQPADARGSGKGN
ncbi:MAG: PstS family phosphate ABC transporter substrate-binding protein [Planctomycetota bacterium]